MDVSPLDTSVADVGADADAGSVLCDVTKAFGAAQPVAGLATATTVRLSPDYLTAYVAVPNDAGGYAAFTTQRANITAAFGALSPALSTPPVRTCERRATTSSLPPRDEGLAVFQPDGGHRCEHWW